MAKKYAAISNRFPFLMIGPKIQFVDGVFETDDEEAWAELLKNDWFGIHIHPRDPMPESAPSGPSYGESEPAPPPPTEPVPDPPPTEESTGGRVVRGSRGTRS